MFQVDATRLAAIRAWVEGKRTCCCTAARWQVVDRLPHIYGVARSKAVVVSKTRDRKSTRSSRGSFVMCELCGQFKYIGPVESDTADPHPRLRCNDVAVYSNLLGGVRSH